MLSRRIAVLATAEPFGFGPISKLGVLSAELLRRGHDVHFVGSGTALEFANQNQEKFSSLATLQSAAPFRGIDPSRYDVALSVMDPRLIAWAKSCDLRSVYVDSLFWAWEWPPSATLEWSQVGKDIARLNDAAEAVASIQRLPMHTGQFAAHYMTDLSCVQQAESLTTRSAQRGIIGDVRPVGAIVDLAQRKPSTRESWLVSISGALNELTPLRDGVTWTNIVLSLLEEAIAKVGTTLPVTFTGNPQVLAHARPARTTNIRKAPLSHVRLLQRLNRSIACLAPPGLTTLLEAVGYQTPLILLPAQHYGHIKNIDIINGKDRLAPPFPEAVLWPSTGGTETDVQRHTNAILEALEHAEQARGKEWRTLVDQLSAAIEMAATDAASMTQTQRAAATRIVAAAR